MVPQSGLIPPIDEIHGRLTALTREIWTLHSLSLLAARAERDRREGGSDGLDLIPSLAAIRDRRAALVRERRLVRDLLRIAYGPAEWRESDQQSGRLDLETIEAL